MDETLSRPENEIGVSEDRLLLPNKVDQREFVLQVFLLFIQELDSISQSSKSFQSIIYFESLLIRSYL
jgi:hypothetical protein